MQTIPQFLTSLVYQAVVQTELSDVLDAFPDVRATKNPKFGDFQSNHAFDIGRKMRTNPRDIAKRVMEQLPQHPAIEKVDIAGPGFLNFHMRDTWLCERLRKMMEEPQRGIIQSGNDQTVVIDYSSPNVAKRMHIGHMRSTIIGNALDRLYRASGWRVIADNHIGDWGTQFGKLIVAWNRMADEKAFEEDPIGELERLYVHFSQNATEEDLEQARMETAKLQAGDPTNRQLWSTFIEESMKEFEKVYQRLGIHFDETLGESAYNDALPEVVSSLKACGLSTDSEGASIIRFPEDT
ncbi:MAG: arginine--tRNA ligase, partial [Myxococcota bacterium]|nr:arginine--tRNA ligase [Myxococcota bacterium]